MLQLLREAESVASAPRRRWFLNSNANQLRYCTAVHGSEL
jgi:hypothetical protein